MTFEKNDAKEPFANLEGRLAQMDDSAFVQFLITEWVQVATRQLLPLLRAFEDEQKGFAAGIQKRRSKIAKQIQQMIKREESLEFQG